MSYQVKLKVKEILEERKITQKKLAEVSGIMYISNMIWQW